MSRERERPGLNIGREWAEDRAPGTLSWAEERHSGGTEVTGEYRDAIIEMCKGGRGVSWMVS